MTGPLLCQKHAHQVMTLGVEASGECGRVTGGGASALVTDDADARGWLGGDGIYRGCDAAPEDLE